MLMDKRSLAGLSVNAVGLGTAATFQLFSNPSDSEMALRKQVIDRCLENGTNFIDTSPMYGESERMVGMATHGKRELFQFATKVWTRGLEAGLAQVADSFRQLRTDYIEVFQIHNLLDWRVHLPEMERLKEEGKIGLIGITHYEKSSYPEMASIMKTRRIDTIQIPYNPMERECEEIILPLAEELGIGVIVMRPFGGGSLARRLQRHADLSPLYDYGVKSIGQALLAWVLADSRISVVIPATTRPERVEENALAGTLPPMPAELRDYLTKAAGR